MYDFAGFVRNQLSEASNFVRQSLRVMSVASKPKRKEFERIVKISALGMLLVGLLGTLISTLVNLLS